MHELSAYDEAIEEGLKQGEIRVLLMQGRKRFGPPSAAIEAELTAINDRNRLERMAEVLLTASSWKEFLSTP